jgi:hypothetical protein
MKQRIETKGSPAFAAVAFRLAAVSLAACSGVERAP